MVVMMMVVMVVVVVSVVTPDDDDVMMMVVVMVMVCDLNTGRRLGHGSPRQHFVIGDQSLGRIRNRRQQIGVR